jgi:PadR family transcriptional regulator, regulatory protein AphA
MSIQTGSFLTCRDWKVNWGGMSLRHALLGLLREGPASGYDLLRIFRLSLHTTWPATQSQVYTELTKLADAGLLSASAQGPRGRKEYTLTDAGLAELRRWLLQTKPDEYPRSEALLRVFLLGALSRDEATNYLDWLADRAAADAAALKELEDSIDWDDQDLSFYGYLVLDFGKRLRAMTEEWARWAAAQTPPSPLAEEPFKRPAAPPTPQ